MAKIVQNKNDKGNPYHDEKTGEFTKKNSSSSSEIEVSGGIDEDDWLIDDTDDEEDDEEKTFNDKVTRFINLTTNYHDFNLKEKEMSIEEDNELINKDNYYKIGGIAYRSNCTHCSIAYELRRRGLDVKAKPIEKNGIMQYRWPRYLEMSGGIKYIPKSVRRDALKNEMISEMVKAGEGARFQVRWGWTSVSGHATTAEIRNGEVIFIDPQTGMVEVNDCKHFANTMPSRTWFMRVDNIELDPSLFKDVIENVKK